MNYNPTNALPSEHQFKRLQKWLTLTLVWFVAHVLATIAPAMAARCLADARRNARNLLLVRAFYHAPRERVRWPEGYDPRERVEDVAPRQMAGLAFAQALSARGALAQCRALYAVLQNADVWIARIARRLRRGFTRLHRRRRIQLVCMPSNHISFAAPFSDTS